MPRGSFAVDGHSERSARQKLLLIRSAFTRVHLQWNISVIRPPDTMHPCGDEQPSLLDPPRNEGLPAQPIFSDMIPMPNRLDISASFSVPFQKSSERRYQASNHCMIDSSRSKHYLLTHSHTLYMQLLSKYLKNQTHWLSRERKMIFKRG